MNLSLSLPLHIFCGKHTTMDSMTLDTEDSMILSPTGLITMTATIIELCILPGMQRIPLFKVVNAVGAWLLLHQYTFVRDTVKQCKSVTVAICMCCYPFHLFAVISGQYIYIYPLATGYFARLLHKNGVLFDLLTL